MKKVLTISLLSCLFCLQPAYSQLYEVNFPVGKNSFPGTLMLKSASAGYAGVLTIQLPTVLNISLVQDAKTADEIRFLTSSPATECKLYFISQTDSIRGTLLLGGNRSFSFSGIRTKETGEKDVLVLFSKPALINIKKGGIAFPTLSPDGTLLVYSTFDQDFAKQTIAFSILKKGKWSAPEKLPFSGAFSDRSPAFDPAGAYLYFSSTRPLAGEEKKDYDLWRVRFENGRWGEPEWIEGINSVANDYQPSVTSKGLYFSSEREGGMGGQDIYFSSLENGVFGNPENLGELINSKHSEMSVFVTTNEDYLILSTSNPDLVKYGNDDLVFFRKVNGHWKFAATLGSEINTLVNEYGAFLSSDEHWLYYTSDCNPPAKIYKVNWHEVMSGIPSADKK